MAFFNPDATASTTTPRTSPPTPEQARRITEVVQQAGRRMKDRFSRDTRPTSRDDIERRIEDNDAASLQILLAGLDAAYPGPRRVEDEIEEGALPSGDWWVIDPMEGAINHVHGMTDWCVTVTLVRDNVAMLAVVDVPLADETYVAIRGRGAYLDGGRLAVSAKTDLAASMVGTAQASALEGAEARERHGRSATEMLRHSLTSRLSVPATWQLIQVAAGRMEAFWQFSGVLSGLMAGALLVEEAGGKLSDTRGRPWKPGSADFVAAAPGVHERIVHILSSLS